MGGQDSRIWVASHPLTHWASDHWDSLQCEVVVERVDGSIDRFCDVVHNSDDPTEVEEIGHSYFVDTRGNLLLVSLSVGQFSDRVDMGTEECFRTYASGAWISASGRRRECSPTDRRYII